MCSRDRRLLLGRQDVRRRAVDTDWSGSPRNRASSPLASRRCRLVTRGAENSRVGSDPCDQPRTAVPSGHPGTVVGGPARRADGCDPRTVVGMSALVPWVASKRMRMNSPRATNRPARRSWSDRRVAVYLILGWIAVFVAALLLVLLITWVAANNFHHDDAMAMTTPPCGGGCRR